MERGKLIGISVLVFAIILVLGLSGGFSSMFTGRASSNIVDCVDTDGGVQAEIGGNVIGSFDPTKARRDFCVNSTTLGEYYCEVARSDGKVKEIFCEFGCIAEGGVGVCETKAEDDFKCVQGCSYNGECLPVGTRVAGRHCDFSQVLRVQKEGDCENNYECKSNLCISGNCLSEEGGINFLKDAEKTYFWE